MHEQERQNLESNLSLAVEQIQNQFSKSIDSVKDSVNVTYLCQCVQDILQHGLKERILHWPSHSELTFWPLVLRITCKEVVEEIKRLELPNDVARCQIWIRQGIRENTLGSYFNVISEDKKLLKEFYQPYALLNSPVEVQSVKNLLIYGISSVDFDISLSQAVQEDELSGKQFFPCSDSAAATNSIPQTKKVEVSENGHESPVISPAVQEMFYSSRVTSVKQSEAKKRKKKKKMITSVALIADEEEVDDDKEQKQTKENEEKSNGTLETRENSLENQELRSGIIPKEKHVPFASQNDQHKNCSVSSVDSSGIIPKEKHVPFASQNDQHKNCSVTSVDFVSSLPGTEKATQEEKIPQNTQQEIREPAGFQIINKNKLKFNTIEEYLGIDKEFVSTSETVTGTKPRDGDMIMAPTNKEQIKMTGESLVKDDRSSVLVTDNVTIKQDKTPCNATFSIGENDTGDEGEDISSRPKEEKEVFYTGLEEDFNFVPGIHKQEDELMSRTSSFSSFTGSGSFRSGRGDTIDSFKSTASTGNSEGMGQNGATLDAHETKSILRDDSLSDFVLYEDLLGMDEDHFSSPESFMGVTTTEELRHSIQGCKELIKESPEHSLERKKLVEKLVMLRLKLQESEETPVEESSKVKKILGHQFLKAEAASVNPNCDKCGKAIWTMWQLDFVCKDCRFHSHRKCLDFIRRPCARRKLSDASYILQICPESGLSSQQYKCAECRKRISFAKSDESEARLCDSTGQYYCEDCHWNDTLVIPARVIHNWDFTPRKVARQTKQLLDLMVNRPMLNVEELNPTLLKYIGELREVKRLREEVLIMKKYFLSCQEARESKLLLKLQERQHFVHSSCYYSLQDLIDVENGSLLPFLTRIHSLFLTHIKTECQTCRGKGFLCEICKMNEVIFAFDPHAHQCKGCKSVYHKICFKDTVCPKCERRRQRLQKQPDLQS